MKELSVVELLAELVAIPSVSGAEDEVSSFAFDTLVAAGLDVERLGNTLVARIERRGGPRLLMNTHLDTVPVGEGWTHEPFAGQWREGRLYGRGANDAKASVAAMIHCAVGFAARKLAYQALRGEVVLALTEREETDNTGIARVVEHLGLPDAAVTGEPTGLEVVRAQSGLAVLRAEWTGRSCHAAHVARVPNESALQLASSEVQNAGPWIELTDGHSLLGSSTVVPTVMRAGDKNNVVPDHAEVVFDARLAPPHDAAEVSALLSERMPRARVSIRSERLRAVETPEDHPLVQTALACAGRERAIGSSTLSDMALLSGVPAVKCGPGATERSHTPDEFVLASEVEAGAAFYARFVPAALEALTEGSLSK